MSVVINVINRYNNQSTKVSVIVHVSMGLKITNHEAASKILPSAVWSCPWQGLLNDSQTPSTSVLKCTGMFWYVLICSGMYW